MIYIFIIRDEISYRRSVELSFRIITIKSANGVGFKENFSLKKLSSKFKNDKIEHR